MPPAADILDSPEAGPAAIRGSMLRTGGYLLGIVLTIASTPLLIRHLGVVDYGRYLTVVSLVFIVGGVTEAGLTNIGVREYASRSDPERRARVVSDLVGLRMVLTLAGVGIAIGFALAAGYTAAMVLGCVLAGAGLVLTVMQASYVIPLSTGLRLGWVTAIELIKQVAAVTCIVALVIAGAGLVGFYAVAVVAAVVALAVTVALVRGDVRLAPSFHVGEWWTLVRDAIPYAAATALGIVYFRVTIVLMGLVSSAEQVGIFSASFRIVEVLAGIPWLLATSTFPILVRAARDDRDRLAYATDRLTQTAAIVGLGTALTLALAAPFAIEVVAGPGFEESVEVLRIQAPTMVFSFLMATWGFVLLSLHLHAQLLIANAVALVVAVGLTLALSPGMGAQGAAVATVAAEAVLAVGYAIFLFGRHGLRVSVGWVPRLLLAALVAGLPPVLLGLPSLVAALVAGLVFLVALRLLRVIPREIEEVVLSVGRR